MRYAANPGAGRLHAGGPGQPHPEPPRPLRRRARADGGHGGKLVAYYHSFGEYHAVVITEDPEDPAMGAAGAWAVDSGGHLKTYKLIPLLTVDEAMEGLRKAGELGFRGPSGSTSS